MNENEGNAGLRRHSRSFKPPEQQTKKRFSFGTAFLSPIFPCRTGFKPTVDI